MQTEQMTGGIVLCGGLSTRMGTSKALLPFGPETMLQRVVRLLGTVVSPIVVVSAAGQELPSLPAGIILTSDEREASGPLEGIRAGLAALPEDVDAAYITSCDVPLLVPAFVQRMIELGTGYDIAITEIDGFAHPLSAVYRRAALPHAVELLAADERRVSNLFKRMRTRRIPASDLMSVDPPLDTLRNLNTREDYAAALAAAGYQPR